MTRHQSSGPWWHESRAVSAKVITDPSCLRHRLLPPDPTASPIPLQPPLSPSKDVITHGFWESHSSKLLHVSKASTLGWGSRRWVQFSLHKTTSCIEASSKVSIATRQGEKSRTAHPQSPPNLRALGIPGDFSWAFGWWLGGVGKPCSYHSTVFS